MGDVQRYRISGDSPMMMPDPAGHFVCHDDYAVLALVAQRRRGLIDELLAESRALAAKLAQAERDYALERKIAAHFLADRNRMAAALREIADWKLPAAYDRTGKPSSYEVELGSSGARDYIRAVARAALADDATGAG